MTKTVALLAAALSLVPVAQGKATRYNPGIMEQVVKNRVKWRQLDLSIPHAGYIALADPCHLGEQAWIRWPDGRLTGPYLVADCGAKQDQDHLVKIRFAVDLSWELAQQFNVVDRPLYGVTVYIQRPLEKGPNP